MSETEGPFLTGSRPTIVILWSMVTLGTTCEQRIHAHTHDRKNTTTNIVSLIVEKQ